MSSAKMYYAFLVFISIMALSSCSQQTQMLNTDSVTGSNNPYPSASQTGTLNIESIMPPTSTSLPTPFPMSSITPEPTDSTNRVWLDPIFGPCISCELEAANVEVNSNGFVCLKQNDLLQRWVVILDGSSSSQGRIFLLIEITRHPSIEQGQQYSSWRKSQLADDDFTDIQYSELNHFPSGTWMMQQHQQIVMLGSTYGQFEFVIYLKTSLDQQKELGESFHNIEDAIKIVAIAAQAQFKHLQAIFPLNE